MNKVICKLFGTPLVTKDGKTVVFPYKKAEALFYYLIIKKHCFRDALVDLFWGSVSEDVAKKSLRNAVYIINKTFGEDILVSPQRAIIMLNPEVVFDIDMDMFNKEDCCTSIDIYSGEILEGFLVKDADAFERWLISIRAAYRDDYVSKLQKAIQACVKEKNIEKIESLCKCLIRVDEFNEKAYRMLMNVYRKLGQYDKCIDVYNNLSKLLSSELSILPDIKTNDLLAEIIKEKAARHAIYRNETDGYFYGRQAEIQQLNENYHRFWTAKKAKSIIVLGEAGLGKSALVSRHLKYIEADKVAVLKTSCYQAEENYLLKPWNDILYQLSLLVEKENIEIPVTLQRIVSHVFPAFALKNEVADDNAIEQVDMLKYQVAEKAIIDIFKRVAEKKKIIFIFEDIQWIDVMSFSLIQEIIFENHNKTLMFVMTSRNWKDARVEKFIIDGKVYGFINAIELKRFTKKETIEFACGMMPEFNSSGLLKDSIYMETEGNTFFIVEFLNNIKHNELMCTLSPKMKDILKGRFLNVSEEGKKILSITAMFFDKVTLEELLKVSGKSELELMDSISELEEKNLLKEIGDIKDIGFVFTHQKLREFVYSQLPVSKKKILHLRIARLLETRLKGNKRDALLYSKLIYHFENGGNALCALKYTIKNLEGYLGINHETFPVFYDESVTEKGFIEISDEQVENDLLKVRELIKEIKEESGPGREIDRLELSFKHMVGRGYIWSGDYKQGIAEIKDMIEQAMETEDCEFALKGYRQMIYFGINTFDIKLMETYIEAAMQVAKQCGFEDELCILMRLKGIQRVMDGQFSEGEMLLEQAISEFKKLKHKEKYSLNIAASYNFIGESKRRSMAFSDSFEYYDKAIALCEQKGFVRGLPIFNTNAGQAAYDMGDYIKAKVYFQRAIEAYLQLNSLWGCSTAYGYMALLLIREGVYQEALQYTIKAEGFATLIQNPYEIALVYRVKAEIRKLMMSDTALKKVFSSYLPKEAAEYCQEGIRLLSNIKNCYEEKLLQDLSHEKL